MKYVSPLLIKLIITTSILWLILGSLFGVNIINIVIISITLTIISFAIGDLYILPKIGNIGASMVDLVLTLALVWALGSILFNESIARLGTAALLTAIGVSTGELLVHWYLKKLLVDDHSPEHGYYNTELQTEFAAEMNQDMKQKNQPHK